MFVAAFITCALTTAWITVFVTMQLHSCEDCTNTRRSQMARKAKSTEMAKLLQVQSITLSTVQLNVSEKFVDVRVETKQNGRGVLQRSGKEGGG